MGGPWLQPSSPSFSTGLCLSCSRTQVRSPCLFHLQKRSYYSDFLTRRPRRISSFLYILYILVFCWTVSSKWDGLERALECAPSRKSMTSSSRSRTIAPGDTIPCTYTIYSIGDTRSLGSWRLVRRRRCGWLGIEGKPRSSRHRGLACPVCCQNRADTSGFALAGWSNRWL